MRVMSALALGRRSWHVSRRLSRLLLRLSLIHPETARLGYLLPDHAVPRSTAAEHYTSPDRHQTVQRRTTYCANAMSKAHEWCADAYGACESKTNFKDNAPVSEQDRVLTPQLYQHSTPIRYTVAPSQTLTALLHSSHLDTAAILDPILLIIEPLTGCNSLQ